MSSIQLRKQAPFALFLVGLAFSCWTAPSQALAQESFYVINQKPGTNTLTLDYTQGHAEYSRGSANRQTLGAEYRRALDGQTSIWGETHITGLQHAVSGDNLTYEGTSLGDIDLGIKRGVLFDMVTLIFGSTATLSPGAASDPRLGNVRSVNGLSGTQRLSGYLGIETYSENLAIGSQIELNAYSDIRALDNDQVEILTNPHRLVTRILGFVEVPVTRELDLGFVAALARPDLSVEKFLLGGIGNQYEAGFYGHWKFDKATAAFVRIEAENQKYPVVEDRLDLSFGLRHQL